MQKIEVSILCLSFNHEKYLRRSLDGMLAQQTDFGYEIVIHDDASTDGSVSIIQEYMDKYPDKFIAIFEEENQYSKHIDYFNVLMLPKAHGRYVAICEGDDFWTSPHKLQLEYDAMEAHPECSMVTHKVQGISEDGSKNLQTFPSKPMKKGIVTAGEAIHRAFHDGEWVFHTTSYFFRKEMLQEGFRKELPFFIRPMYGDQAIFQLAAMHGDFYYIDEIMSCYRMGSLGSVVKRDKNPVLRKGRSERAVKALESFNECTGKRFETDVEYALRRNRFVYYESNKEYQKLLTKEFREFYEEMPWYAKLHVHISAAFPIFDSMYYILRRKIKGY